MAISSQREGGTPDWCLPCTGVTLGVPHVLSQSPCHLQGRAAVPHSGRWRDCSWNPEVSPAPGPGLDYPEGIQTVR